jgi:hypothetical protein
LLDEIIIMNAGTMLEPVLLAMFQRMPGSYIAFQVSILPTLE